MIFKVVNMEARQYLQLLEMAKVSPAPAQVGLREGRHQRVTSVGSRGASSWVARSVWTRSSRSSWCRAVTCAAARTAHRSCRRAPSADLIFVPLLLLHLVKYIEYFRCYICILSNIFISWSCTLIKTRALSIYILCITWTFDHFIICIHLVHFI